MIGDVFRPPRRRRSRRWALPVALTILIALVVAFGLLIDDEEAPPLFAEDLRDATQQVSLRAAAFNEMIIGIGAVDRVTLDKQVDEVLDGIAATREVIASAPENDPALTGPLAILGESLVSWEGGVTSFRDLVFTAADEPLAVGLEIEITDALIDLRAGDRLYASFLHAIDIADTPDPVVPYPSITFVSESYPFSNGPVQIVNVARADGSRLELRAELAIEQVATVPEMITNTSDQRVVTQTEALAVQVVILNGGNTPSEPITVTLSLVGADDSTEERVADVPSLDAGAQTTVEFTDLPVTGGVNYRLVVSLPLVQGEEASEDNQVQWDFLVNEETATTTTAGG